VLAVGTRSGWRLPCVAFARDGIVTLALPAEQPHGTVDHVASRALWELGTGWHGREVYAACFLLGGRFAAAAGKDGTVRVMAVPSLRTLHLLRGHASVVRTLAAAPDSGLLLSAGGKEEMGLYAVQALADSLTCHAVARWDARRLALDASNSDAGDEDDDDVDDAVPRRAISVRIMASAVVEGSGAGDGTTLFAVGTSGGRVCVYAFGPHTNGLRLVAQSSPAATVLSLVSVVVGDTPLLLAGTTTGAVLAFDMRSLPGRASESFDGPPAVLLGVECGSPRHTAGVNALQAAVLADGRLAVVSGGDDQAVCCRVLSVRAARVGLLVTDLGGASCRAHAAGVTALGLLRGRDGALRALSCGPDQRLCVWAMDVSDDGVQLSLQYSMAVDVPDVAALCVAHCDDETAVQVLIAGFGLQLVRLDW
jgi:hypothetical protein